MNFVTEEMINPYRYMCKQTLFHLLFQCQRRKNPGSAGNPAVGPAQLVMKAVQGLVGGGPWGEEVLGFSLKPAAQWWLCDLE